jgi:hypothetical protein
MKPKLLFLAVVVMFWMSIPVLKAQVLFSENFETSPVTSILNDLGGEVQLTEGPSPCGKASRGNTGIHNTASVDFLVGQNSTYFLALNPQSPLCGGYNVAYLHSMVLNFASADSLVFSCRYFISGTLGWGGPELQVNIKNGLSNHVIWSDFSVVGAWTNLTLGIPSAQIGASDSILILIGGGEGVAIDDITITNIPISSVKEQNPMADIIVSPNPVKDILRFNLGNIVCKQIILTDVYGKVLLNETGEFKNQSSMNLSQFASGIYFVRFTDISGRTGFYKIVKE